MKPITAGTVLVAPPLALAGVLGFTDILEGGEEIGVLLAKSKGNRKLITDSGETLSNWYFLAASFLGSYRTEIRSMYEEGKKDFATGFSKHKKYCEDVFKSKAVNEKSAEFLKAFNLCTRKGS